MEAAMAFIGGGIYPALDFDRLMMMMLTYFDIVCVLATYITRVISIEKIPQTGTGLTN